MLIFILSVVDYFSCLYAHFNFVSMSLLAPFPALQLVFAQNNFQTQNSFGLHNPIKTNAHNCSELNTLSILIGKIWKKIWEHVQLNGEALNNKKKLGLHAIVY